MPYLANMDVTNSLVQAKQLVGNGQCVALIHAVVMTPPASTWHQGAMVKGSALMRGTVIATFDSNGRYGNHTNGTSHTAIYLGQTAQGIQVLDQWKATHPGQPDHPPQQRTIFFNHPQSHKVNQGEAYYVVQ